MDTDKKAIRQRMQTARGLLLEAVEAVDEETALASTENPNWRVRDVLAHVAGAETGLLRTVDRFLAGEELPAGFSLDYWNQRQVEKRGEKSIPDLMAELAASRQAAWAMLERLSEEELQVEGRHAAGFKTTVAGLFYTIANHELDHGNEIRTALGLPIESQANWREAML